jgi:hypothetical protein
VRRKQPGAIWIDIRRLRDLRKKARELLERRKESYRKLAKEMGLSPEAIVGLIDDGVAPVSPAAAGLSCTISATDETVFFTPHSYAVTASADDSTVFMSTHSDPGDWSTTTPTPTKKFQSGDLIVCIDDSPAVSAGAIQLIKGDLYEVRNITPGAKYVSIKRDADLKPIWFRANRFLPYVFKEKPPTPKEEEKPPEPRIPTAGEILEREVEDFFR